MTATANSTTATAEHPHYELQPARDLLARLRHRIQKDPAKMKDAASELLEVLKQLVGESGPVTLHTAFDKGPSGLAVRMDVQNSWAKLICYSLDSGFSVVGKDGVTTPVRIQYDPAQEAFAAYDAESGKQTGENALEVVINELWGACMRDASKPLP